MKNWKKKLALFLACCMVFTLIPMAVLADEPQDEDPRVVLLLDVFEEGENFTNYDGFTYKIGDGEFQQLSMVRDNYGMLSASVAYEENERTGDITITYTKDNEEDPFWGYEYFVFTGEEEPQFGDTTEGGLRSDAGDTYDTDDNARTHTLVIKRSGNEDVYVIAYINDRPDCYEVSDGDTTLPTVDEEGNSVYAFDFIFVRNDYTLTVSGALTVRCEIVLEDGGDLVVADNGSFQVNDEQHPSIRIFLESGNTSTISGLSVVQTAENGTYVPLAEIDGILSIVNGVYTFTNPGEDLIELEIFYNDDNRWEMYLGNDWTIDSDVTLNSEPGQVEYDNVYIIDGGSLIIASDGALTAGTILLDKGSLIVEDGAQMNADKIQIVCENGESTIDGLILYQPVCEGDPIEITEMSVEGITKDENTNTYTFTGENKNFSYDREGSGKWVLEAPGLQPQNPDDPGPEEPFIPGEQNPSQKSIYEELEEVLLFDSNLWGVLSKAGSDYEGSALMDEEKEQFVDFLWDDLQHREGGKFSQIYGSKNNLAENITYQEDQSEIKFFPEVNVEGNTQGKVRYCPYIINIPVPESDPYTAVGSLYALPQNYLLICYTESDDEHFEMDFLLLDYSTQLSILRENTNPENYRVAGARISNTRTQGDVGIIQLEGQLLDRLTMLELYAPSFEIIKLALEPEGTITSPEWGLGNEPYMNLAGTTAGNPARLTHFFGDRTKTFEVQNAKGTAGDGATITNICVVPGSGIPANAITYDADKNQVTYETDYYTQIPLQISYKLANGTEKIGYVTVTRSGIYMNDIRKPGDEGSDYTLLHGSSSKGMTFTWDNDNYLLYATHYVDNKRLGKDGLSVSLFVELMNPDGTKTTKLLNDGYKTASDGFNVDSYDFVLFKGKDKEAPIAADVIVTVTKDGKCVGAFKESWDRAEG